MLPSIRGLNFFVPAFTKKMPPYDQMIVSMYFMKPHFFLLGSNHVICAVNFIYSVPIVIYLPKSDMFKITKLSSKD